jgi:hypothetical protein
LGKSHYKSNIIGKYGTEKIASINKIESLGYIKVNGKYIFSTTYDTEASIVAAATLLIGGNLPVGSMVMGNGVLWLSMTTNNLTTLATP